MSNMEAPENDPIDEILSEVEELRRELSGEAAAAMAAAASTLLEPVSLETSSESESESESESVSLEAPSDDELMKEFRASTVGEENLDDGDGMESTLAELPREELDSSVKALLEQTVAEVEAAHHEDVQSRMPSSMENSKPPVSSNNGHNGGTVSETSAVANLGIVLSGDLNLRLQSENGGPDVVIRFVDQCLIVQLPDGIEMKFPLGKGQSGRGGIKRVA